MNKSLAILGIRGIPAAHGGFETFAERMAAYMRDHNWQVRVYCQGSESGKLHEDVWQGIRRIHIPVKMSGPAATIEFDIKSTRDALRHDGVILTLGYNTGFLAAWLRICGRLNYINMDGLEWKRIKYSRPAQCYLWLNERIAAHCGTRLIADHPEIAKHLGKIVTTEKIRMIPYGADEAASSDPRAIIRYDVRPGAFMTLIARPEPENSVLEIVRAFSRRKRGVSLLVLGKYEDTHAYQRKVRHSASDEVIFAGPVYGNCVGMLRQQSLAYLHGHRVGGTNPSLVEALAAGNPIIAHDNPFNRWVAADAGLYFKDEDGCSDAIERILSGTEERKRMGEAALKRWQQDFTWDAVLKQYRGLIEEACTSLPT